MGNKEVKELELEHVEEVVEESTSNAVDSSDDFDFGDIHDESIFFANSDQPREGFENIDPKAEAETETETEEPENVSFKDTNEEDERNFKLVMGLIDNSRAMLLSLYIDKTIDHTDKYTYYKDWNDAKHKPVIEAGRVVAKKYRFSAFQHLPEFTLLTAIILSSYFLWKQAKDEKEERAQQKWKSPKSDQPQTANSNNIRKIKKII